MKFIKRAVSGYLLFAMSLGIVGIGIWRIHNSINAAESSDRRPSKKRIYIVDTDKLQPTTVNPVIKAFGEVKAWRKLEVRSSASGPIIKISPNFRDGASVNLNELLFEVDPDTAIRRVNDAKAAVFQAEAELLEAQASLNSLTSEVMNTEKQLALKKRDLQQKKNLRDRRLITQPVYDEVVSTVTTLEQTLTANQQTLFAGQIRVKKAKNDIQRTNIILQDAEHALKNTRYYAPFAGRLTGVTATLGRRVTENENLAVLIDPSELEVAFRIRNDEFGRLIEYGEDQKITPLPVSAVVDFGERLISASGKLDRIASVIDPNQGGRTVFARLDNAEKSILRPGDFVTVTIEEPGLEQVAVVPAQAITQDGKILVVGADGRLKNVQSKILRRQDDMVILQKVPFGSDYVTRRLPYLAEGVSVTSRSKETETEKPAKIANGELIALGHERRAILIAAVKSNKRLPEDRKKSILTALSKDKAPRQLVDRLEQQLNRKKGRT